MTSAAPPTEFFPGINFNASFYNLGQSAVTLDYLNSNFLRSTGYAISRAQYTLFNGSVNIQQNLDVSQNINASAYLLNGVPFTPSQWTTSGNDIYYTTGNVGIGKTNPSATYKLDVSGNINADKIFRAGTELTQYTDTNVRTVLSTSAGTNMTWNTGTNKFDVAAPYTDTNTRTVLSTSAGTNMTWNTGTNKFDVSVVFPPSYTDTNTRTVLSTSAGTNMTWNTGTNKFDVAVTSYTLPTAGTGSGGTLGGVKVDGTTISVNATTGIISRTGNTILLNNTSAGEYYGWNNNLVSGLYRVGTNGQYSPGSLVEDIVLRSSGDVLLQSGIGDYALRVNATNNNIHMRNSLGVGATSIATGFNLDVTGNVTMRNALVVGGTTITSGYTLDVKGDVITSGNINLANTSTSLFWGGTNSNLGRAGVAGQYSTSSAINDIVLRSGNKLILQSGTGAAGVVIDTANNVGIGINAPTAVLDIVKTHNVATNIDILKMRFDTNWGLKFEQSYTGAGNIQYNLIHRYNAVDYNSLTFRAGNVGIGITAPNSTLHLHKNSLTSDVRIQFTDNTSGTAVGNGVVVGKGTDNRGYIWNYANQGLFFGTNAIERVWINADGSMGTVGSLSVGSDLFITSSRLVLRGTSPTLYLRDTDNRSGMIHMNSNIMYFLNAAGNDSETWTPQNGQDWCLQLNMNNNDATFGGAIICGSYMRWRTDRWNISSDGGSRLYFQNGATTYIGGYSSTTIEFRHNDGTMIARIISTGQFACHFQTISSTNTDYIGVAANTSFGALGYYFTYVLHNTFTGFHRCYYEDDEIFNNDMTNEEVDIFKNNYKGRIVISTGKIKTDLSRQLPQEEEPDDGNRPINYEEIKNQNPNNEWYSAIDKDGITIEDAIPIVKLCSVKKDKRVYGVLGSPERSTNNKKRLIVNSVGEGAICVCNTNGNIENGDYIQSSDILGYGEKQDDDLLHNYTVAKAVMDCSFELDSPYYQCFEIENGLRVAFIACTYHCG